MVMGRLHTLLWGKQKLNALLILCFRNVKNTDSDLVIRKNYSYRRLALKKIAFIFLLLCCAVNSGWGQTKTYLKGGVTGNRQDLAALGPGDCAISAPLSPHITGVLPPIFRFYYGSGILDDASIAAATMTSSKFSAVLGLSGGNAYLQFRATGYTPMPAGKSVYIKIGTKPVTTGLTVSVGSLLSVGATKPIVGSLYAGAANYDLGTTSENTGSIPALSSFNTEFLIDKSGIWHVGIHPLNKITTYNSARIKLVNPAGTLTIADLSKIEMSVHNAFYYSTSGSACNINPMFATRGEVNGISLDLGSVLSGLSLDTIIANPQYAIDSNNATYCAFRSGLLSLGALSSVSQSYLFDHPTAAGDGLRLQLSIPNTLLSVALLNNISIDFYRNDSLKSSDTLGKRLLGLDLLTLPLLSDGYRAVDAVLRPGTTFDRATLNLGGGILSVSLLGAGIRVHEVAIAPSVPAITVQPVGDTVCQGDAIALSVAATPATSYQWQLLSSGAWSDIASATSSNYTTTSTLPMNGNNYRVRVTGSGGCPQTVNSNNALIGVKAKAAMPAITFGP